MTHRIAVLTLALLIPMSGVAGQASHQVTMRAEAGPARGYGGDYTARNLASLTAAIDFRVGPGSKSGPILGFGFSRYDGGGEGVFHGQTIIRCDCGPGP